MNYQPLFNALCDLGCPPPIQTEMDRIVEICERMSPKVQASEGMYQALRAAVDAHDSALASSLKYAEARGEIVHIIEPEWVEQARKALAMADNTNETL